MLRASCFVLRVRVGVAIREISDQNHPACGQLGCFATRDFASGDTIMHVAGLLRYRTSADDNAQYCVELTPVLDIDTTYVGARCVYDAGSGIGSDAPTVYCVCVQTRRQREPLPQLVPRLYDAQGGQRTLGDTCRSD